MNALYTTKKDVKYVPKEIKRIIIEARGNAKPPKGWREEPGAIHVGGGIYVIPYSRIENPS